MTAFLQRKLSKQRGEEDRGYGFGPSKEGENVTYDYILLYYKGDGQSTEHFVWEINVPVSNFAQFSLPILSD